MKKPLTRRRFLETAAKAVTYGLPATTMVGALISQTACNNDPVPEYGMPQKNLFDGLESREFVDQDGRPVNINALRSALSDSYTTLSFGYEKCTEICPMGNSHLGNLGHKGEKKLTSIFINVDPEDDFPRPGQPNNYLVKLKSKGMEGYGIEHDIIILYPAQDGVASQEAVKWIPELADKLGMAVYLRDKKEDFDIRKDYKYHPSDILLHAPGGKLLSCMNGQNTDQSFDMDWVQRYLGPDKGRGR
jgi:cytochrome oxidase Cu insertion factor (SCO1/SenC/PrrC family)